ncbi:unnamed protein product [Didymodactylos carnosus]|uniref:Tetratricopeptide repeat protein n=1 Tax=Didymodactylos carnosus TaxID=1234261 RepID=A0A815C6Z6_9BILA|nr:unnamed protein product [Didymodactylos carnosus]CAF1281253.1 unnamed protein product [Didymodactylos carnosus]CAF3944443.1 unnamed protein product [Didymodactylos carnosus]CAF4076754.1 unnamed protein product [Didymodactylos carnosus]
MNSFLSTSRKRDVALVFADPGIITNNQKRVLFEIEVNTRIHEVKPFADVSQFSSFEEYEILFMLGSIFRTSSIQYSEEEEVWIVKLILCSEQGYTLTNIYSSLKEDIGEYVGVLELGRILYKMGKYDKAEKYLNQLLNTLKEDSLLIGRCYHALGIIASEKGDYEKSLLFYNKSVEFEILALSIDVK